MDPKFLLAVIGISLSVVINASCCAYVYGKLTNKVATHDKSIDELKQEDKRLWSIANHNTSDIANLRGRMHLNGEAKKAAH